MLSENLKNLRKAKGLSQEELAIKLNVVRQTVSKWEKGLGLPDINTIEPLANALNVSMVEVMRAELITEALSDEKANRKWMKVNLFVPQFDVSASTDLKETLRAAGLTKIFKLYGNDFSPSIIKANEQNDPVYLDSIHQDTRVKIDEKGVVAASYIELNFGAGSAMPPDEIIDFVLDRPFVFAVTKSQIPLFVGTVNTP